MNFNAYNWIKLFALSMISDKILGEVWYMFVRATLD